jgi:hypothetical protein
MCRAYGSGALCTSPIGTTHFVTTDFNPLVVACFDQILSLKKDNPAADTSALEREIDVMVYALYGLSEEEIAIVEE